LDDNRCVIRNDVGIGEVYAGKVVCGEPSKGGNTSDADCASQNGG